MSNFLVAIDFSKGNTKVIEEAAKLAKVANAKIWLIHVASPDPDFVGYEPGPQSVRDARAGELKNEHQLLAEYIRPLKHDDGLLVEALLVQGPTVETLVKEIDKLKITHVFIGSHGHGELYNMFVGSVCADLIKEANIPIIVVPVK